MIVICPNRTVHVSLEYLLVIMKTYQFSLNVPGIVSLTSIATISNHTFDGINLRYRL